MLPCRPEKWSREGPSSIAKPPTPAGVLREVPPVGPDDEYLLPGVGSVDPGARWDPSRLPPLRLEENVSAAAATAADSAEGALGGAGVESRAPAAPANASPVAGDARGRPIILGEDSAEAVTTAV